MKRKLFAIFLLLAFASIASARTVVIQSGGVPVAASSCDLIDATFEGESDGTDLDAITDVWTEDGAATDVFEIDTAQAYAGSASAKIAMVTALTNRVYRSFTEQASGVFTVEFYVRYDTTGITDMTFLAVGDGTFNEQADGDGTLVTTLQIQFDEDFFHSSNAGNTDTGTNLSADTWYKIEIIIDVTNKTYDIEVNDTLYTDDADFRSTNASLAPDRVWLRDKASGSANSVWIDNLCVKTAP